MYLFRAGFVTFLLCAAAAGQGYGSISGLVVDGENRPVERAVITLSTTGAHPQDAVAWSDEAGRFGFAYLPPGSYRLYAQKTGLGTATFGTRTRRIPTLLIHVQAGENRTDLVCRLGALASISGTIVDESGDGVAYAQVLAFRQMYRRGTKALWPINSAQADGQGHYRLSNLSPGSYVVCTQPNMGQGFAYHSEVSAKETPRAMVRPEQCYPGSDGPKTGSPIAVQRGKGVSGIDLQVGPRPAVQLHGHVQAPPEFDPKKNSIRIEALGNEGEPGAMRFGAPVNPQTLEFQLPAFAAGALTLVASTDINGKQYRGIEKIDAAAQSAGDIVITLQPGVNLSGTAKLVGPDAGQHTLAWVGLVPGEPTNMQGLNLRAPVKPDGAFTIENVPPGIWDIVVEPIPRGCYVKSMMLGKQDVLTEEMRITREAPPPLNIVVGTKGGTVKGDVVDGAGQTGYGAVVLAPEGKWRDVFSFYRWTVVDDQGHFEFLGITPGRYNLYAFNEFDMNTEGPEGLEAFAKQGVGIEVDEGRTVTQKLTLIEVRTGATP